ncbi:MAG: DUF4198 domain-containing protein [Brevundimonas sp.]|uniref:DUF4198 domain-containing protein n=1 Tax=Brevundimonas sp. TaxID=1871086 RepID=UPI00273514F7|nr:DUF4198 domain-containing protein [Brevundimonas sp.]MDP3406382.1 DUF4198 domain-containing protein [Brevundimonas sp.]
MKKFALPALALMAALAAPLSAQAHRGWMMPSSTILSGESAWVSFDAGASNGVFIADHAPLRLSATSLVIMAPDGTTGAMANLMQGAYRSTFDVHINKPGTWKVANVSAGMSASYEIAGETRRWRGSAADFATAIPAGATNVSAQVNNNRLETFITLGAPTETVFAPTGQGLEMVPVTHPNDLVAGEAATFTLLNNGQPAADMEVTVARGGLRYRDNPEEMTVRTAADGTFTVTWPEAGMYWVNAARRTEAAGSAPARSFQYTAVLEVLP